jgi:PAS domain S-box-containing protein
MNETPLQVLLIEDNPGDVRLIREMLAELQDETFIVTIASTLAAGLQHLILNHFDIVLLDLNLPDSFGVDTLMKVRTNFPSVPVVVLTGFDDQSRGVQYVQAGAQDYLVKGILDGNLLSRSIRYSIERYRIENALRKNEEEYRSLIDDVFNNSTVGGLIFDRDHKIVWVNEAMERYSGIPREEMLGQNKLEVIRQRLKYIFEDSEEFERQVITAYKRGEYTDRFECHVLPALNRRERWLEHWSQSIHSGMYAGGRIVQYNDITERKKIETAEHEQRMLAEALRDTAAALTSTLNLEEVLDRILANIGRVVPHDIANIMLLDGEVVQVERRYGFDQFDVEESDWKPRFALNDVPTLAHMAETQQPAMIADIQMDTDRYMLTRLGRARAYAGVPIRLQNEVIGFINTFSYIPNFFNYNHTDRLAAFAEQAAIAIQNAWLYTQSRQLAAIEERQRLARELHDSVTQTLFTSTVIAESALRQWDKDPAKTRSLMEHVHNLTTSALAEMRVLLLELRPASLAEVNLKHLIRQLAQSIRGRKQVEVTLEIDDFEEPNADVKIALYRIAQEALNNVVKHSLATRVNINVKNVRDGIRLEVEDNGRGFNLHEVAPSSLGLGIMRERADDIGAHLTVESVPGEYTRIAALWLVEKPVEEKLHDR